MVNISYVFEIMSLFTHYTHGDLTHMDSLCCWFECDNILNFNPDTCISRDIMKRDHPQLTAITFRKKNFWE